MPKSARINKIKSLYLYTIEEAAETACVTDRTIRTWIKNGLHVMASERPALIRGDDLKAFIKKQRSERKTNVPLHKFYCLKCRLARSAAGGFSTCRINGTRVKLKAICEDCECVMNKSVAISRLAELRTQLDLILEGKKGEAVA